MPIVFPIRDSDREVLKDLKVHSPPGCGRGWWPLVARLLDDIIAHNATLPAPVPDLDGPSEASDVAPDEETEDGPVPPQRITVAQIKEKYGTLVVYADGHVPQRIADAIGSAVYVSRFVCETCGAPGSKRCPTGRVYTACDVCFAGATAGRRVSLEASSASVPPYYDAEDLAWWSSGSVRHVLFFATQSRDDAERERALQRSVWLRRAKDEASAGDWRKRDALDEWALAIADARASATTFAYPEPLQTIVGLLATGRRPDGASATPEQILALLQHASPAVRIAAQMSFAREGPVAEPREGAPPGGRPASPPPRTA